MYRIIFSAMALAVVADAGISFFRSNIPPDTSPLIAAFIYYGAPAATFLALMMAGLTAVQFIRS
ncbi:hypothetical protein GOB93_15675 [Acetobacter musti]|uniref:Uncharacterized protein n=1 Tax=Acetobacter musti TaxID=864732 RepID=A0ABX0JST3_9PROT|nr:hypothetical protein [Acetobacter musti]NHN86070.1 hypothetical protein [Acetobacter musti]